MKPTTPLFSLACTECNEHIEIPLNVLDTLPLILECPECKKRYGFNDSHIVEQMKQFVTLCRELKASENILSNASIAVQMGTTEVKIPFKLLLTRLRSTLDLKVGDKNMTLSYRMEPGKLAEALEQEPVESTM